MQINIIELFCEIDDFCKSFENYLSELSIANIKNKRNRPCVMFDSEIMTILILFHITGFRNFKTFYISFVNVYLKKYFPRAVSYNRFVEIMSRVSLKLLVFSLKEKIGECTGISYIDSTPLKVCHNRRIYSHKVFDGLAKKGKSSTGWFYGFKLHLIINEKGELLSFCITQGNVDDRNIEVIQSLSKNLFGKLFGDRGYISNKLFENLFSKNITLITKLKKNMKNKLIDSSDKLLLKHRGLIESVNDILKNTCQIEHTRHRCFRNFIINILSGISAYHFLPKKPSLKSVKHILILP